MFDLAQINVFTREVRKGGGGGEPLAVHRPLMAGAGTWGGGVCGEDLDLDAAWSAIMEMGGSTRHRPTGGCMPDWCAASPPAPSPSPWSPQPPQLGDPRSRTPPTPGTPLPRPRGPSPPPLTGKARNVDCVLALI